MKYTKGPWKIHPDKGTIIAATGDAIAMIDDRTKAHELDFIRDSDREANARLIAAAPEMLDMLKLLQTCIELDPIIQRKLDVTGPALDALIERIEGGDE